MTTKFGTSGVRGLVSALLDRDARKYGAAFVRYLLESGRSSAGDPVLIGWDLRESSPEIARICRDCVEEGGLVPILCGDVPTPALALAALDRVAPAMMITGSHIPADRNGIKFYRADGEIAKADEIAVQRLVAEPEERTDRSGPSLEKGCWAGERDKIVRDYVERCSVLFPRDILSGLKIGVYEHSSVARDILHEVLRLYGAQTVALARSESFVPVDTEAVSVETRAQLHAWADAESFAAIVSTDGDGDRPLLADGRGDVVSGDVLGVMAARMLGATILVTPVTSNSGIEAAGDWSVVRTRVGSPFVIAGMTDRQGAVLGFEANGGVLVGAGFTVDGAPLAELVTRDCAVPILATLAASVRHGKSIAELVAELELPVGASDRLQDISTEKSAALIAALETSEAERDRFLTDFAPVVSIDKTDGLRMSLADGCVVHLRPSGNAPELRCYVEAASVAQAGEMLQLCLQRAEQFQN